MVEEEGKIEEALPSATGSRSIFHEAQSASGLTTTAASPELQQQVQSWRAWRGETSSRPRNTKGGTSGSGQGSGAVHVVQVAGIG